MNKGIKRPGFPPYTINSAIDTLLKEEFDIHRENGTAHYVMEKYHIDALPYKCPQIDAWRHNFTGIQVKHTPTDFLVYGAVDDIWVNPHGELIVVDYKATGAKEYQIYDSYKRQIEIYQWLLLQNGHRVYQTGYFVFAKVDKSAGFAQAKLSFDLLLEPLEADTSWVEDMLYAARQALSAPVPGLSEGCAHCQFIKAAHERA
jgi:hypothetical protein